MGEQTNGARDSRTTHVDAAQSRRLMTDDHLITLIKLRDEDAFTEMCRRYERQLFRTALRILRNKEDAEDVLQETLSKAFRKIDTFKGDSRLSTWLTSITVRSCLMHLRTRRRLSEFHLEDLKGDDCGQSTHVMICDQTIDIEGTCLKRERQELLKAAVAQLPKTLRQPLETHLRLDCSLAEIADQHNLSVSAVKSRLLRARLAVKEACERRHSRPR